MINYLRKTGKCIAGLLLLMSCSLAVAQDVPQNSGEFSLTLKEAQKFALEHNRTLKNASLDVQKSEAARWQAIATMLPQVSGTVDYANMLGFSLNFNGMPIAMPPYMDFGVTTSVAFSAAQIISLGMSDIAINMSDVTYKKSEKQILDQVKTTYYSTLVMEETVKLLEKNLENLKELMHFTEESVKVGVSEQTEADQLSVQVAMMETSVNSTKRSLEMLYNSMRLQLGAGVDSKITLTQTIDDLMNIDKALALLGDNFILNNNYDYQLLLQNVELTKAQLKIKKWAYAPSVSVFHQYSHRENFSDQAGFNMTPPNMVGVKLSVPIFSSFSRYKAVAEAKYEYNKQLNTLADTQESLMIQHRQLRYNLSSAYESYETQKKNIEVSQRVFDNISRKYEQGMSSSLDVTNSGTTLITAQSSYVQALMELVSAQIALEELLNTDNN